MDNAEEMSIHHWTRLYPLHNQWDDSTSSRPCRLLCITHPRYSGRVGTMENKYRSERRAQINFLHRFDVEWFQERDRLKHRRVEALALLPRLDST